MLEIIVAILPYAISVVSILGVIYTARQARDTQLTAAYFNKMTSAYERFWECFTRFVYSPNNETRDALAISVYISVLYASESAAKGIQFVYNKAIEHSRTGALSAAGLDECAGLLEELLHEDVKQFRTRARRYRYKPQQTSPPAP